MSVGGESSSFMFVEVYLVSWRLGSAVRGRWEFYNSFWLIVLVFTLMRLWFRTRNACIRRNTLCFHVFHFCRLYILLVSLMLCPVVFMGLEVPVSVFFRRYNWSFLLPYFARRLFCHNMLLRFLWGLVVVDRVCVVVRGPCIGKVLCICRSVAWLGGRLS